MTRPVIRPEGVPFESSNNNVQAHKAPHQNSALIQLFKTNHSTPNYATNAHSEAVFKRTTLNNSRFKAVFEDCLHILKKTL